MAKIATDIDALRRRLSGRNTSLDARRAEKEADRLERHASVAIDYAIATVDQARLAVLDAVAGGIQAEEARRADEVKQVPRRYGFERVKSRGKPILMSTDSICHLSRKLRV